jgi:hypothetical protein
MKTIFSVENILSIRWDGLLVVAILNAFGVISLVFKWDRYFGNQETSWQRWTSRPFLYVWTGLVLTLSTVAFYHVVGDFVSLRDRYRSGACKSLEGTGSNFAHRIGLLYVETHFDLAGERFTVDLFRMADTMKPGIRMRIVYCDPGHAIARIDVLN